MFTGPAFQVGAVMRLVDMISGPLRMIQSSLDRTERGAASLAGRMSKVAKSMMPIVTVAGLILSALGGTALATIPTGRALGELASVGIEDMQALESAAQRFSNQWAGTTKAQFLSAAYDIKSGISSLTDAGVAEFTRLSALTGKATKSTVSEMTSLFAVGYGIYKNMYADMSDMRFGEIFSAGIAASVQNFKTTGSEMSSAISALGASAANANIPLEEQLSIMGMLQATMSGSEAGNRYRAVIDSAARAGQRLGLSFVDANNNLLSMPEILTVLRNRYGETLTAIEKMEIQKAFGTKEAVAVIDLLYGRVGDLTANIHGMGNAMQMGTGFTARMAETMNQDLGAVLQIAGQRLRNLIEIVGQVFVPAVLWLSGGVSSLILVLQRIGATDTGKAILGIVGFVAAAVVGFTSFAVALAGAGLLLKIVAAAVAPFVAGLIALSWPVWAAVGAVTALYIAYRNNFGGIADIVGAFIDNAGLVVRAVREIFNTLSGSTGSISRALADELEAAGLLGIVETVARVAYRVRELLSELWESFSFVTSGITEIFTPVIDSLTYAFEPLWDIVESVASALFGASAATDAGPWRTLGAVVGVVLGSAFRLLAWAVRTVLMPLEWAGWLAGALLRGFIGLGEGAGALAGLLVTEFSSMLEWLGGLPSRFMDAGAALIDAVTEGIKSKLMAPVDAVKEGFGRLRNLLPFSDAKEGPLSDLAFSGRSIMDTLSAGVRAAAPGLRAQLTAALVGAAMVLPAAAAPDLSAARWDVQAPVAPGLPDAEGIARWRAMGPPRPAISADSDAEDASSSRARGSFQGKSFSIRIDKLVLQGVKDPEDFISRLQALVEAHDV